MHWILIVHIERANVETKTLKEREKEHLQEVLDLTHWDLEKVSRLLKIPLSQVKLKIREHGFVTEESSNDR